ncbi:UNVERIFIED_CONTAM: hypothetical protein HDU68_001675 [Siphonaria sp. JEL0065]|nr:hypothetical protein HDU68_001675 [Siphonaria sp. JEL0065]
MQSECELFQLCPFAIDSPAREESLFSAIESSESIDFGCQTELEPFRARVFHQPAELKSRRVESLLLPRVVSKWPKVKLLVDRLAPMEYRADELSALAPIPAKPDSVLVSSPPEISKQALDKGLAVLQLNSDAILASIVRSFKGAEAPTTLYREIPLFLSQNHPPTRSDVFDDVTSILHLLYANQVKELPVTDFQLRPESCIEFLCNSDNEIKNDFGSMDIEIPMFDFQTPPTQNNYPSLVPFELYEILTPPSTKSSSTFQSMVQEMTTAISSTNQELCNISSIDSTFRRTDYSGLITSLKSRFANCESFIITTPMDTIASKRIPIKQMTLPTPFFHHSPTTLLHVLKVLDREISTWPDLNSIADAGSSDLQWNPYPLLCQLVADSAVTSASTETAKILKEEHVERMVLDCDSEDQSCNEDEGDEKNGCFPWEIIGDVDFEPCDWNQVDGAVIVLGYFDSLSEQYFGEGEEDMFLSPLLIHHADVPKAAIVEPIIVFPRQTHCIVEPLSSATDYEFDETDIEMMDYIIKEETNPIEESCSPSPKPQAPYHALQPLIRRVPSPYSSYRLSSAPTSVGRENSREPSEARESRLSLPPRAAEFSARHAVDSFMNLRQAQGNRTRSLFLSTPKEQYPNQPQTLQSHLVPVYQKFESPYTLERLAPLKPSVKHTYIVGSRVVRNPRLLELLEKLNVNVIERDYGEGTTNRDLPLDFDFIIDERTCVISGEAFEFNSLYATILRLSLKFSQIHLVVDLSSPSPQLVVQNLAPQMVASIGDWFLLVESLLREVGVEARIVWSESLVETVRLVREIGDDVALNVQVQSNMTSFKSIDVSKPWVSKEAWESRVWLSPEESAV